MQPQRYAALGAPDVRTSAAAQGALLDEVVKLENASLALIHDAADAMRLAARGYHRVLRSRARSPTSTAVTMSAACTLPRRYPIGCETGGVRIGSDRQPRLICV
jgi:Magnesium chelatase, subunit ChlI C-terminal